MIVKGKVAVFVVASVVLMIAVGANAAFSLIDRRRKSNWKNDKSTK
jgi:hypothetical protein